MPEPKSRHPVRAGLDMLYNVSGAIGAVSLVVMLSTIVLQMAARWTGHVFPGATNYAGYFMACASFFALAYTLNHGAHIRVSLVLTRLGRFRRLGEIWCFSIGTMLAAYFAYYAIKTTYWSKKLHDISQGQDATPIWIPQLAMCVGTVVLTIALADHLFRLVFFGETELTSETIKDHYSE